ncbi:MAG: hypothetical protein KDK70_12890 [Myxococcales bacterium]|nr:hypothetical protein [Myxococcales bacterium]
MSTANRALKALSRHLLAPRALNERLHKAVMTPGFSRWCRHNPCTALRSPTHDRRALHAHVWDTQDLDGPIHYLEFGVYRGESLRWWVEHNRHPASRFVGFDSFEGLPEDWNARMPQGHFSTAGRIPAIDDPRCWFEVGWFHQTLPPFLARPRPEARQVVHLDADLYSSTLFVLTTLAPTLRAGDVLIFDEFSDLVHEYRAYTDFISAFPLRCEAIAMHDRYTRVALRVTEGLPLRAPKSAQPGQVEPGPAAPPARWS